MAIKTEHHWIVAKQFDLQSSYQPAGDQPGAIDQLIHGIEAGLASQTLLGVTGSGKTFTMANVIHKLQRPTIVMITQVVLYYRTHLLTHSDTL